jgi:hypothetical protein
MDKFASDDLTAAFLAPMLPGIEVGGWPLPVGGRNGTVLMCDLYGDGAVGRPLIGDGERSGLAQPPPYAALTDSGGSWGANLSSMPPGASPLMLCDKTIQLNGANVSDAGMPA